MIPFIQSSFLLSQVAFGKDNITNSSVSIEFSTENKGLILPWVTSSSAITSPSEGSIIYDNRDKKVKFYTGSTWSDLSTVTGNNNSALQDPLVEQNSAKVTIGLPTTTDGILVLEDSDKAMILPKVSSPHLNIINPTAGTIVYDTNKKQLALYNGQQWTFWKAPK